MGLPDVIRGVAATEIAQDLGPRIVAAPARRGPVDAPSRWRPGLGPIDPDPVVVDPRVSRFTDRSRTRLHSRARLRRRRHHRHSRAALRDLPRWACDDPKALARHRNRPRCARSVVPAPARPTRMNALAGRRRWSVPVVLGVAVGAHALAVLGGRAAVAPPPGSGAPTARGGSVLSGVCRGAGRPGRVLELWGLRGWCAVAPPGERAPDRPAAPVEPAPGALTRRAARFVSGCTRCRSRPRAALDRFREREAFDVW